MHQNISPYIIITALNPDTLVADVEALCKAAIQNNFPVVFVPPLFVRKAKEFTAGSSVHVAAVIGFPFGYCAVEAKLAEILLAIVDGADELNMVINIAALKNNDWQYLANEINSICPIVKRKGKILTVIIESSLLSEEEIIKSCTVYGAAGIDFIQTATGFATPGDAVKIVGLIRKHVSPNVKIHSGENSIGYRSFIELVGAGADRVSSNRPEQIVNEATSLN